jgi:hypothetical protein
MLNWVRSVVRAALSRLGWPLQMLTREEAQRIVEADLAKTPELDLVVLEDRTEEFPMLWVFRYATRAWLAGDKDAVLTGGGPRTVHRRTGALRWFESSQMDRLADYERRTRLGRNYRKALELRLARYRNEQLVPAAESPEIMALIERHPFSGPDPWGYYRLTLPDGVAFEISPRRREAAFRTGGVRVWDASPALSDFLFEVAVVDDLIIEAWGRPSSAERPAIIFFKNEQEGNLPEQIRRLPDWAYPTLCKSPQHLWSLLFA